MNIAQVNSVLERAIVAFQLEEIEALYEKFKVPTPQQMAKKTGMALDIGANEAMQAVDAALSPLTSGHGKLTDPNRTPSRKELLPALNELIQVAKGMRPKDRKEVLARLRNWQKTARAHAKRLQQAAYSYRVGDVGKGDMQPARNVRDDITQVIGIIAKYRGGGFGKKQTTAKPGTGKKRTPKPKPYQKSSEMSRFIGMSPEERKEKAAAEKKMWAGKYVVGDATVQTFIRVLEAALWKAARDPAIVDVDAQDVKDQVGPLKRKFASKLASDDKRTLRDLLSAYEDYADDIGEAWMVKQLESYLKSGKLPYGPGGTQIRPYVDKRQMGMKFEALKRLKLALVG